MRVLDLARWKLEQEYEEAKLVFMQASHVIQWFQSAPGGGHIRAAPEKRAFLDEFLENK